MTKDVIAAIMERRSVYHSGSGGNCSLYHTRNVRGTLPG